MSKQSKACDISPTVKELVWERDGHCCIICGSPQAMPNAHYISRSHGGLGVPENIVTLCLSCHHKYDNGGERENFGRRIRMYLKQQCPNWNESKLTYNKYQWLEVE